MQEGYYWIHHAGNVQVACYTHERTEDPETGIDFIGVWHLMQEDDICHCQEVDVLNGPLEPPRHVLFSTLEQWMQRKF